MSEIMIVKELIEELKKMPQDIDVKVEGCDCEGFASKISFHEKDWQDDPYVLIER